MNEFTAGQLVRLKDPATLTPPPGEEAGDQEFWELIQNIPMYYRNYDGLLDVDESGTDFPHRTEVVGVFLDVLKLRPRYEEYRGGSGEWHFREGELEAIEDEQESH